MRFCAHGQHIGDQLCWVHVVDGHTLHVLTTKRGEGAVGHSVLGVETACSIQTSLIGSAVVVTSRHPLAQCSAVSCSCTLVCVDGRLRVTIELVGPCRVLARGIRVHCLDERRRFTGLDSLGLGNQEVVPVRTIDSRTRFAGGNGE